MKQRLVTLLTERAEDAHLARRTVRYDELVLVVHPGAETVADQVARHEGTLGGTEPQRVDLPRDFDAMVERLRDLLRGPHNILNAAGGDALSVTAALVVAFELGCETWFCQQGRAVRLPVMEGLTLSDRIPDTERQVMHVLAAGPQGAPTLADRFGLTPHKTGILLRRLRKKDMVTMHSEDGRTIATLTPQGQQVIRHLQTVQPL